MLGRHREVALESRAHQPRESPQARARPAGGEGGDVSDPLPAIDPRALDPTLPLDLSPAESRSALDALIVAYIDHDPALPAATLARIESAMTLSRDLANAI